MNLVLAPGESIDVTLADTDGKFTISYGKESLTVTSELPDQHGREGVIYHEHWQPVDTEDLPVRNLSFQDQVVLHRLLNESAGKDWDPTKDVIERNTTSFDMGMDSLDLVEVIMRVEEEFGVQFPPDYEDFPNAGALADKLAELLAVKSNASR